MPKSYRPLRCLLVGSSLAVLSLNFANASDWTVRNPRLSGPALNAVAGHESRAVAVGLQGHIVTSGDGVNWAPQNVGENRQLRDVIYANNTFVAVGALHDASGVHSLALTSPDGQAWTEQPTDSRAWKSIAHGNGTFVVVGDHTIDTSTDGVAWTRRAPFAYVQFQGIAFGNGQFVTMGVFSDGRGMTYHSVQRSSDGMTWTGEPAPANVPMRSIAFGNGQFVMVGDNGVAFTSPDGVAWTQHAIGSAALQDVTFANGRFVAVGSGGALRQSVDGARWVEAASGQSQNLSGVGFATGRFIAVGEASTIFATTENDEWSSSASATSHDLRAVSFAGGRFVAVGGRGTAAQSTDGMAWRSNPVVNGSPDVWFNSVAYGNGAYVAAGGLGGAIFSSSDANLWTQRNWNLGLDNWRGAAYANGRFVVVGEASSGYAPFAAIFTSTDSATWSLIRPGTGAGLHCVTHGNGTWVAAGEDVYTSADATTWTQRTVSANGTAHAATFGAGKFILAGELGGVLVSTDGTTWTHNSAFADSVIRGLSYGNNQFVAVGERNGAGVIWSSADGLTWVEDASAPVPLAAVTFGNGTFTAVGANGFVLQSTVASAASAARLSISKLADGTIELGCHTQVGKQYRLQASADGHAWEDVANFRADSSVSTYRPATASTTMRLYRLVSP